MIFEGLSEKLANAFKKIKSKGKLSKADVEAVMREVKLALLAADVNFNVVRTFVATVTEKAVGEAVMESLNPAQMTIKIICDELTVLLGGETSSIIDLSNKPSVVMLLGLQGVGKTTTTGKLAKLWKKQNKKVLLVACDIYRPAAIKQLEILAEQVGVDFFSLPNERNVSKIAKLALDSAIKNNIDIMILDTAGRLDIDEELIEELQDVKSVVGVNESLLVVDSLSGQTAVDTAKNFNEKVGVSGVILTKLDSDSRGGVALSVKTVTGVPIKFAGVGEKLDDFEAFHPDRIAKRILGMGDMMTLIERAEEEFDEKEARELQKKIESQTFDFNDYLAQIKQVSKMGGIQSIMQMMPGNNKALKNAKPDEHRLVKIEAIINSMTPYERTHPDSLKDSRKKRIAAGSGTSIQDINSLLKQHKLSKQMMKQFSNNKNKFKNSPFG